MYYFLQSKSWLFSGSTFYDVYVEARGLCDTGSPLYMGLKAYMAKAFTTELSCLFPKFLVLKLKVF